MGRATHEQHLADVERARRVAAASMQVQQYVEAIVKIYASQHPDDPILTGYRAAVANLKALTDEGIVRGHKRLLNAITTENQENRA